MPQLNTSLEEKPLPIKKNGSSKIFEQFRELMESKLKNGSRVGIFTHPSPDPDAIGSQMGLGWLIKKVYDVDVDMFIAGQISHPQNLTMEKLLSPKLIPIEDCCPDMYDFRVLMDTIPANANYCKGMKFDAVIDHHVEVPVVNGDGYLLINLHTGSACGTVYGLIRYFGVGFEEDVDYDQQVATAMMVGIYTDTCGMLGDRTTEYDRDAYNGMFDFRDPEALKEIAKFKRPKHWIALKAAAANEAVTEDGVAVVGVGMVSMKHRDILADVCNDIMLWEGINLSVAFSLIDGNVLQGSVRSMCASVSAAKLCRLLGEERGGSGWGHTEAAGYNYTIAGFSLENDEDEAVKGEVWALLKRREVARIFKMIRK